MENFLLTAIVLIVLVGGAFFIGTIFKRNKVQKEAQEVLKSSEGEDKERKEIVEIGKDQIEKNEKTLEKPTKSNEEVLNKAKEQLEKAKEVLNRAKKNNPSSHNDDASK